ncbi:MAG: hypothetical protein U0939_20415 [Pirellulales bacterium]
MNGPRATLAYRRLRAPRTPDSVLLDPPREALEQVFRENRASRQAAAARTFGGLPLGDLVRLARRELLVAAREHAERFELPWASEIQTGVDDPSVAITGHQPQLFHPGVWFKNFVLAQIGRRTAACVVNLIVDNDTQRGAAIKVPSGSADAPQTAAVPWDDAGEEAPYEERTVRNDALFASFADRVAATVGSLVARPLVQTVWPWVLDARRRTRHAGLLFSVGRNQLERRLGLETCDVPLSAVADGDAFRRLALELFERADAFRETYNRVLAEYRASHRIRSRSHPVPELAREDDWVEAPLWCWSEQSPRRRRLFVRRAGDGFELTDRAGWRGLLPARLDGRLETSLETWRQWRATGVKIRPRALLTTLFSRLLLGDLFVHGIGGAKYDQLTDALFERFLEYPAPAFVTATATVMLPIEHAIVTSEEVRAIEQQVRASRFHPERWLTEQQLQDAYVAGLVDEKRRWLASAPPRGARLTRHRALGALNEALQAYLELQHESWKRELHDARLAAHRHALLASREYSYCVFSQDDLPRRLLELSARTS